MIASKLIAEIKKPGPIYGDVIASSDPLRIQLVKSDLLHELAGLEPDEETYLEVFTDNAGWRVFGTDHNAEIDALGT